MSKRPNESPSPKNTEVQGEMTRRESFKLASAVTALGVGLGVTLESTDADAAPAQLAAASVGQLSIKLYKLTKSGDPTLVHSFDLGALSHKLAKDIAGSYTIKLANVKMDLDGVKVARTDFIAEQPLELSAAVAPAPK